MGSVNPTIPTTLPTAAPTVGDGADQGAPIAEDTRTKPSEDAYDQSTYATSTGGPDDSIGRLAEAMRSAQASSAPSAARAELAAEEPATGSASGWGLSDGVYAMGSSLGSTLTDVASFAGVAKDEEGNLEAGVDPVALAGATAATIGPTALLALRNEIDPITNAPKISSSYAERFGATAAVAGIKITPTLVSAIVGPAAADGITLIAPNLVKKYKDTKDIKDAAVKKQTEDDNKYAKTSRMVAGGATVGVAAGVLFLLKPEIFKKFGVGVTRALEGSTTYSVGGGKAQTVTGVLDASQLASTLTRAVGRHAAADDAVQVLRTVKPMAHDAVFSNRALVAAAGAIGVLMLANAAAGQSEPDQQKLMWGLTAATGAATIGATVGIGALTRRSAGLNSGTGGLLARNDLLLKPNVEWIKKYATLIAPITAVPAGTAASQYFNIVDDFDDITDARSPFRK